MDNVLVGHTREEHDTRLTALLERAKEARVMLNTHKCEFVKDQLKFLGYKLSARMAYGQIQPRPQHFSRGNFLKTLLSCDVSWEW